MTRTTVTSPQGLLEYGLVAKDGETIEGALIYEHPAFIFDPRLVKNCTMGAFSYLNGALNFSLHAAEIGRYSSIGGTIGPPEHPSDWLSTHPFAFTRPAHLPTFYQVPAFARLAPTGAEPHLFTTPLATYIGHDCWVCAGSFVKRGVRVGDGAIIAAGAVVLKDIPPYAIVVGCPGKVVRLRFPDKIVERLLKLQWWYYDLAPHKQKIDFSNIEKAVDTLEQLQADGKLELLQPDTYCVTRSEKGFEVEKLPSWLFDRDGPSGAAAARRGRRPKPAG